MVAELVKAGVVKVAVVFDLDAAGRKGAVKAVDALRAGGVDAVALELPADLGAGGDVDDLHRRTDDDGLADALAGLPELSPYADKSLSEIVAEAVRKRDAVATPSSGRARGDDQGDDQAHDPAVGELIMAVPADAAGEALDRALRPILVRVVDLPALAAESCVKDICKRFGLTKRAVEAAIAEVRRAAKPAKQSTKRSTAELPDDGRPLVEATHEHWQVNDAVISALQDDRVLYSRNKALVTIVGAGQVTQREGSRVADDEPAIAPLSVPAVAERITAAAIFYQESATQDGAVNRHRVGPPKHCAAQVHARQEWSGIRPLVGLAEHPLLAPDGSVVHLPGYHAGTGYFLSAQVPTVKMRESPDRHDAEAAVGRLLALVDDFPWKDEVSGVGWLAMLLSALARPAIDGPVPLFNLKSNVRKSGKSLAVDLVSNILSAREVPAFCYTEDDSELEKILVSVARMGLGFFCWDNVRNGHPIGGPVHDRWLASTRVAGRTLGVNETPIYEWRAIQVATGNNTGTRGDTDTRCIHLVMESRLENPEARTDYRIKDVAAHVREHRAEYLADGLTILRAYVAAGRPTQEGRMKGRFESWCRVVRDPLLWLDLPDCERAPDDSARPTDQERDELLTIIKALRYTFRSFSFSTRDAINKAWPPDDAPPDQDLRDALECLIERGHTLSTSRLGQWLKAHIDCRIADLHLVGDRDKTLNQWRWRVNNADNAIIKNSKGADNG